MPRGKVGFRRGPGPRDGANIGGPLANYEFQSPPPMPPPSPEFLGRKQNAHTAGAAHAPNASASEVRQTETGTPKPLSDAGLKPTEHTPSLEEQVSELKSAFEELRAEVQLLRAERHGTMAPKSPQTEGDRKASQVTVSVVSATDHTGDIGLLPGAHHLAAQGAAAGGEGLEEMGSWSPCYKANVPTYAEAEDAERCWKRQPQSKPGLQMLTDTMASVQALPDVVNQQVDLALERAGEQYSKARRKYEQRSVHQWRDDEVPIEPSIWYSAVLIGTWPCGPLGSIVLGVSLFLNVVVQLCFIIIVNRGLAQPNIEEHTVEGFADWRRFVGHHCVPA